MTKRIYLGKTEPARFYLDPDCTKPVPEGIYDLHVQTLVSYWDLFIARFKYLGKFNGETVFWDHWVYLFEGLGLDRLLKEITDNNYIFDMPGNREGLFQITVNEAKTLIDWPHGYISIYPKEIDQDDIVQNKIDADTKLYIKFIDRIGFFKNLKQGKDYYVHITHDGLIDQIDAYRIIKLRSVSDADVYYMKKHIDEVEEDEDEGDVYYRRFVL